MCVCVRGRACVGSQVLGDLLGGAIRSHLHSSLYLNCLFLPSAFYIVPSVNCTLVVLVTETVLSNGGFIRCTETFVREFPVIQNCLVIAVK